MYRIASILRLLWQRYSDRDKWKTSLSESSIWIKQRLQETFPEQSKQYQPFNVIAHYTDDISARTATQQKKIYGYLVIPENFEENVLSGKTTTLSYYYHYAC